MTGVQTCALPIYLLASVGEYAGEVAFTAYSCSLNYFKKNEDVLTKFTKAVYKGQLFVQTHSNEEVAEVIKKQFGDVSIETLTSVVERYRSINAWCTSPVFSEKSFDNLQNIMIEAQELDSKVEFNTLVDNSIALKVINK